MEIGIKDSILSKIIANQWSYSPVTYIEGEGMWCAGFSSNSAYLLNDSNTLIKTVTPSYTIEGHSVEYWKPISVNHNYILWDVFVFYRPDDETITFYGTSLSDKNGSCISNIIMNTNLEQLTDNDLVYIIDNQYIYNTSGQIVQSIKYFQDNYGKAISISYPIAALFSILKYAF